MAPGGKAQPSNSRYTRVPSVLEGPCGDGDARGDWNGVPPPTADTSESPQSMDGCKGIGTPHGVLVQDRHDPQRQIHPSPP